MLLRPPTSTYTARATASHMSSSAASLACTIHLPVRMPRRRPICTPASQCLGGRWVNPCRQAAARSSKAGRQAPLNGVPHRLGGPTRGRSMARRSAAQRGTACLLRGCCGGCAQILLHLPVCQRAPMVLQRQQAEQHQLRLGRLGGMRREHPASRPGPPTSARRPYPAAWRHLHFPSTHRRLWQRARSLSHSPLLPTRPPPGPRCCALLSTPRPAAPCSRGTLAGIGAGAVTCLRHGRLGEGSWGGQCALGKLFAGFILHTAGFRFGQAQACDSPCSGPGCRVSQPLPGGTTCTRQWPASKHGVPAPACSTRRHLTTCWPAASPPASLRCAAHERQLNQGATAPAPGQQVAQ